MNPFYRQDHRGTEFDGSENRCMERQGLCMTQQPREQQVSAAEISAKCWVYS